MGDDGALGAADLYPPPNSWLARTPATCCCHVGRSRPRCGSTASYPLEEEGVRTRDRADVGPQSRDRKG